ncbi:hypothetical protein ACHAXR_010989, partial [Thalassiosira sp. AJA248-18]
DEEEEEGEEWLSSSSYETGSSYETDDSTVSPSKGGAVPKNEEQTAALAQKAVVATSTTTATSSAAEAEVPAAVVAAADNNDASTNEVQESKATATAAEQATATAVASTALRQKRVKELEAQLDAELENHAQLEQDHQARLQAQVLKQAMLEKERQAQLEAQLERELKNHAELERAQKERELEFQQRAAAVAEEESRALAQAREQQQQQQQLAAAVGGESRALDQARQQQQQAAAVEEESRALEQARRQHQQQLELAEQQAAAAEEQQRRKQQQKLAEETQRLQEERENLARARLEQEQEEEQRRLHQEIQMEQRRIQALREERERQEERRIQDEREMQRRVHEEEQQRFLQQEQEMEQQRRLLQQERELEQQRLEREREREVQRLRTLREERDRQQRLAQEEQRRLEEERRQLQEQRELHQRLERERQHRLVEGQNQQQEELNVARAMPPPPPPLPPLRSVGTRPQSNTVLGNNSGERSLRASGELAMRQGYEYNPPSEASSSPITTRDVQSLGVRQSNSQPMASRYDGVDDDELNWRLDCYASLSDYTIVVNRARPGPYAPDFDTADVSAIDFVVESPSGGVGAGSSTPKKDVYYVHKALIAVGSRRSELLGRRIREAERNSSRGRRGPEDGHLSEALHEEKVHEVVMLESAANAMGMVLDFCYYHDRELEINVENAVPLVYLGKRYKIRALLEQAEMYVMENIKSTTAMYFLLDSYLYHLDDILARSIDVTAANLADTVDFNPIYRLPPELFRRVILSRGLKCDSELLSLIVYSYCGEHHAEEIDVEYFRELTKQRIMPDIDPKVALMLLKFYVDLILDDDENCVIMEVLQGDSLMNRCVTVVAKHWQGEVCEPLMIDAEWDNPTESMRRHLSAQEPAALHRSLPSELQNYLLEKCILAAKNDVDSGKTNVGEYEEKKKAEMEDCVKGFAKVVKELQGELKKAKSAQGKESVELLNQMEQLQLKAAQLEAELDQKTKAVEEYKHELKQFRRVPGIHNFGEVSRDDATIINKTRCTYSANPDHHYPNHRRGNKRPTQMPSKGSELENLAKENGYVYDDGKGELLPVFYYQKRVQFGGVEL